MQLLNSLSLVLAALMIGCTTATPASVRCATYASGNTDEAALQNCLNSYRNGNWNGMNCGGLGWFKGGRAYNSPNDCYDACRSCIETAINDGIISVQCDDYEGSAQCWMGYH